MILLIADLHLSSDRSDITQAFIAFLHHKAVTADKLFIVGDFFDYWLGDDAIGEFELKIINELANLAHTGTKIYVMHGNRDFLIGHRFCALAKCELIIEPYLLRLQTQNILVMHGDILCTKDVGYLRMRKVLRSKLGLWLLRNLPLKLRQKLALFLRGQSKKFGKNKNTKITDCDQQAIIKVMRKFKVTTLIHGHTHRPQVHNFLLDKQHAQRIVVGDWQPNTWYAVIENDGNLKLESFIAV